MFRKRNEKKATVKKASAKKAAVEVSSRKARRQAKKTVDPLGGFSMEQLFGLDPVSNAKRSRTRSVGGSLLALPVALVKLPLMAVQNLLQGIASALVEIVKLPVRVIGAILGPWGRNEA